MRDLAAPAEGCMGSGCGLPGRSSAAARPHRHADAHGVDGRYRVHRTPIGACDAASGEGRARRPTGMCMHSQEWEAPQPSRRPDIFPEFDKINPVILPKPLPGDPEMPDEELEESVKRTTPGDPDPEQKPGEPPEEPERPPEPGAPEPERKTDIPNSPE